MKDFRETPGDGKNTELVLHKEGNKTENIRTQIARYEDDEINL